MAWSRRHPVGAAIAYGLCYLAVATVGGLLVGMVAYRAALTVLVTAVGVGTLALTLLMVLSLCRVEMRSGAEAGWMAAALVAFCLARPGVFAIAGRWLGLPAGATLAERLSVLPAQALLGNLALIVWAVFLGRLVSRVIREEKMILPVAVVASIADIVTVYWGVVAKVSQQAPEVVEAFSAAAPVKPPPGIPAPILTSVGIGDFLFIALFLAAAVRYSLDAARSMWLVFASMLVAMVAFLIWPQALGMPGLPFISAGILLANWRHLRYSVEEKRALVVAGVVVAAVLVGIWMIARR
jgi:hypothetical protein